MITSSNFSQSGAHQRRTNSGTLSFDLSNDAALIADEFAGMEKQVAKAIERALKKTGRWLRTHTMRHLSKEMAIKQASLKNRFILAYDKDKKTVNLWVGLLAIAAEDLGGVRQNAAGTKAGSHQFDGAFYTRIYGDYERVYIRARRNRVMQHDVVRQNRKPASYRPIRNPNLIGRFPVQAVGISIEDEASQILLRLEQQVNKRFGEILKQELNYAINLE
ncbi:hypothetical protein G6Z94_09390 [Vibrio aestuarianus]|uniref:hypothetical protein n=1 Tax=Vibrio aestuarianus TaxID=28171 RepID=UPI001592E94E|nr:hypothetical protein [Vibrio aestuarianus]NGZ17557.1 hypothetical protein [Vibrio aestuarianus]